MATAGTYNMIADQGATFSLVLTYKDSSGALVNLTGYTARMAVRTVPAADTVALSLTTENGRVTLGGAAGTITLNVAAADMVNVDDGQYVYDLELVQGVTVTRLVMGTFLVRPEVTR
jgi:hypothetical protein